MFTSHNDFSFCVGSKVSIQRPARPNGPNTAPAPGEISPRHGRCHGTSVGTHAGAGCDLLHLDDDGGSGGESVGGDAPRQRRRHTEVALAAWESVVDDAPSESQAAEPSRRSRLLLREWQRQRRLGVEEAAESSRQRPRRRWWRRSVGRELGVLAGVLAIVVE